MVAAIAMAAAMNVEKCILSVCVMTVVVDWSVKKIMLN